jgi:ABC-type bacteriocin/lantibiotic exporter with double-glycine peptidase domain
MDYIRDMDQLKISAKVVVKDRDEILQCGQLDNMIKRYSRDADALQAVDRRICIERYFWQIRRFVSYAISNWIAMFLLSLKPLGHKSTSSSAESQQHQDTFIPRYLSLLNQDNELEQFSSNLHRLLETHDSWRDDCPGATDLEIKDNGMIEFTNVDFQYDSDLQVFQAVNVKLPMGSMIAITGPNGGGKSTFMRLASGRLQPTGGAISICGQNLQDVTKAR